MFEFTEKRRKAMLELIKGYGYGYITDDECTEMCDLIEGTLTVDYDKLAEEQAQQDAYESGRVFH
tara:strand:- start:327 stop:521 length:195 start_codon:yes stop_codon:yes gene_type:complete